METIDKVASFTDEDLKNIWNALEYVETLESYDETLTIEQWMIIIRYEMSIRGIKTSPL